MSTFRTYRPIRFDWRRHFTPAIRWLILINCGVFVLLKLASLVSGAEVERGVFVWLGLIPYSVVHGLKFWQPVTYLFLHAGVMHLIINMLTLWMFGCDLERSWGTRRFLSYYFLTGVGAGLCVVLVNVLPELWGHLQTPTVTVGASGAIYGILMACALLYPDRQVWLLFPPIALPMRIFVLLWGAFAFFSSLEGSGNGISHIAHLGGLLVGYLYLRRGSFFFHFRNHFTDWRQRRLRRKFEVYMREHRDEPPPPPGGWVH
jgi:membrane associated rhomboid family serine protease